jgi:hypothetical protein
MSGLSLGFIRSETVLEWKYVLLLRREAIQSKPRGPHRALPAPLPRTVTTTNWVPVHVLFPTGSPNHHPLLFPPVLFRPACAHSFPFHYPAHLRRSSHHQGPVHALCGPLFSSVSPSSCRSAHRTHLSTT